RGGVAGHAAVRAAAAPLHPRAAALAATAGRPVAVRSHPGQPDPGARRPGRLPVRPALRPGGGAVPGGRAGSARGRRPAPPVRTGGGEPTVSPMIEVHELRKTFRAGRGLFGRGARVVAVDGVSFTVEKGTTFGLVGESGSGKSTTARMVCRLLEPDSGRVRLDGTDIVAARGADLKALRRRIQMVFQDPFASLNPRWTVGALIAEGMRVHGLVPAAG